MENILKKINGIKTVAELNTFKNNINEAIEKHMKKVIINEEAMTFAHGSLGFLKETFENMSPELFKIDEGRKLIKLYKKIVTENKDLGRALNIFENLRKIEDENTVEYVVENIKKYNLVNKKHLDEGIDNLRNILFTSYVLLGEDAKKYCNEDNIKYNNAVMVLIEKQEKLSNISDYANSISIIKENVKNRDNVNAKNLHYDNLNKTIDKVFENYFEKEEIKENKSHNMKENAFEMYKTECMNKLSEAINHFNEINDKENLEKVKNIHEQVSKKVFSNETVNEDITNLIGITKCFD